LLLYLYVILDKQETRMQFVSVVRSQRSLLLISLFSTACGGDGGSFTEQASLPSLFLFELPMLQMS